MAYEGSVPTIFIARDLAAKIPDQHIRRIVESSLHSDTPDIVKCVAAWHALYGQPIVAPALARDNFSHMTKERLAMRFGLIVEEFKELCADMDFRVTLNYEFMNEDEVWVPAENFTDAIVNTEGRDIGRVADACVDLMYVIVGFMFEVGINPHAVIREVQASNMTKMNDDGRPKLRDDGKVLKGPRYVKPDCEGALRAHGLRIGDAPTLTTRDDEA